MTTPNPADGNVVLRMADKLGWPVRPGVNLLLEGETDERYIRLADRLCQEAHRLRLLGDGFTAFPVATGVDGGCDKVVELFGAARLIASLDLGPDDRPIYRFAVLLDGDAAGNNARNTLKQIYGAKPWQEVFVLRRLYPQDTADPNQLEEKTKAVNTTWPNLECAIEDLLPDGLADDFADAHPNFYRREPTVVGGRRHYHLDPSLKGRFCRHVEENAIAPDVAQLIQIVRDLRRFLRVRPPAGSAI